VDETAEAGLRVFFLWLRDNSERLFLLVLLAASLCLNVDLGWQLRRQGESATIAPPPTGITVPSISVQDLLGRRYTIPLQGAQQSTVLYFFRPGCGWCDRNFENIKTLASLRGVTYRFVALSITEVGVKEYIRSHPLNFDVYTAVSADFRQQFGIRGTPQTIVVSTGGQVVKNWEGAFSGNLRREVEAYFDVRLPGLTASQLGAK
jgi:hypothetical protein